MSTPPEPDGPTTTRRFGSGGMTRIGFETFIAGVPGVVAPESGCGIGVEVFGANEPGVESGALPAPAGGVVNVGGAAG